MNRRERLSVNYVHAEFSDSTITNKKLIQQNNQLKCINTKLRLQKVYTFASRRLKKLERKVFHTRSTQQTPHNARVPLSVKFVDPVGNCLTSQCNNFTAALMCNNTGVKNAIHLNNETNSSEQSESISGENYSATHIRTSYVLINRKHGRRTAFLCGNNAAFEAIYETNVEGIR